MANASAGEFVAQARSYCALIEGKRESQDFARDCLTHVASLYHLALFLPCVEMLPSGHENLPARRSIEHDEWNAMRASIAERLPVDFYWEILDPAAMDSYPDELGVGQLSDDLADIWRDLSPALQVLDNSPDNHDAALDNIRRDFCCHWGRHAVDAMKILHGVCFETHESE